MVQVQVRFLHALPYGAWPDKHSNVLKTYQGEKYSWYVAIYGQSTQAEYHIETEGYRLSERVTLVPTNVEGVIPRRIICRTSSELVRQTMYGYCSIK